MAVQFGLSLWTIPAAVLIALVTYSLVPGLARRLKGRGIVGKDLHKTRKTKVAERGGIVLLLSLAAFTLFTLLLTGSWPVLYVLGVSAAFGLYGLWDDVKQLGKYSKLAVTILIAAGALALSGTAGLMLVPVFVLLVVISNIFNMFAGFNGLEIGCSSIVAFFFALCCIVMGRMEPFYLSLGAFFILVAFLAHNKYPAKIFPGNVGTMLIGGFFASLALYYGLFLVLIPLLTLYIMDILLKGWSAGYFSRPEMKPTRVNGDGTLSPDGDYLSLTRLILRFRRLTEKRLVSLVWKIEIAVGSVTFLVVLAGAV